MVRQVLWFVSGQQIVTSLWITGQHQISADFVEYDRRECSHGVWPIVAKTGQHLQGRSPVHPFEEVWYGHVVEVGPVKSETQQIAIVFGLEQVGPVELLIVGAMAALDPAVVTLTSQGIAA